MEQVNHPKFTIPNPNLYKACGLTSKVNQKFTIQNYYPYQVCGLIREVSLKSKIQNPKSFDAYKQQ
jgi:hypothetical protein